MNAVALRCWILAGLAAAVLIASAVIGDEEIVGALAVLAAGTAIGEMVALHPAGRAPLPLSFAAFVVLARSATPIQFLVVIVLVEVVVAVLRPGRVGIGERVFLFAERCAEAFAAGASYYLVTSLGSDEETVGVVLGALTIAALSPVVVSDLVTYARERTIAPLRARGADVAVVTSGVLMAVGYEGIAGEGQLGLWGPILFAIPLVAAWYSFELLASTRKSFDQTIQALAAAPELGGLVREGHAERVAGLALAMGESLSLGVADIEHLHTAALLHHLGAVCLDEPEDGSPLDTVQVAIAGADMLRASDVLAPAGDIVAAEPVLHRPQGVSEAPPAALPGMILKVASAYDELTEGNDDHAVWAVEALYTGPGYVYDGRVLGALERALERRGALAVR